MTQNVNPCHGLKSNATLRSTPLFLFPTHRSLLKFTHLWFVHSEGHPLINSIIFLRKKTPKILHDLGQQRWGRRLHRTASVRWTCLLGVKSFVSRGSAYDRASGLAWLVFRENFCEWEMGGSPEETKRQQKMEVSEKFPMGTGKWCWFPFWMAYFRGRTVGFREGTWKKGWLVDWYRAW